MLRNDKYYHALYNKLCELPFGETALNHKNEMEKEKFEEHIKMWISTDAFSVFDFYIEFNNEFTGIKKCLNHFTEGGILKPKFETA